jgi:hypothetical protein
MRRKVSKAEWTGLTGLTKSPAKTRVPDGCWFCLNPVNPVNPVYSGFYLEPVAAASIYTEHP